MITVTLFIFIHDVIKTVREKNLSQLKDILPSLLLTFKSMRSDAAVQDMLQSFFFSKIFQSYLIRLKLMIVSKF